MAWSEWKNVGGVETVLIGGTVANKDLYFFSYNININKSCTKLLIDVKSVSSTINLLKISLYKDGVETEHIINNIQEYEFDISNTDNLEIKFYTSTTQWNQFTASVTVE